MRFIPKLSVNLPPRDSSPGGDAFVMVSNSAARSTWHDVESHDNRPEKNTETWIIFRDVNS